MKRYLLGFTVLMVFLSAAVIPASAAVTKITLGSVFDIPGTDTQISPNTEVPCEKHITDMTTFWWQDSLLWKRDINEKISGTCLEGTNFECNARLVINAQTAGTSRPVSWGICWFTYPDGSTSKNTFPWIFAEGEWQLDLSEW